MEVEQFKGGAITSPGDHRDFLYAKIAPTPIKLSRKRSRRNEFPVPPRDQLTEGACVGFATAGLKDWQEFQSTPSRKFVFSPRYIYEQSKLIDGIPGIEGTYPRTALSVLLDKGACLEATTPFSPLPWPHSFTIPEKAGPEAAKFKILSYARLQTIQEVKQAIDNEGPIVACVLVCENFLNPGSSGKIGLPNGRVLGLHCILVTGYDDDTKYFEFRNSWNETWGNGGYGYLPYEYFTGRVTDLGIPYWAESWSSVDVLIPPRAKEVVLRVGYRIAWIDGMAVELDQEPSIVKETGRTLVPLRFLAECMGYLVNYNPTTKEIRLISPE